MGDNRMRPVIASSIARLIPGINVRQTKIGSTCLDVERSNHNSGRPFILRRAAALRSARNSQSRSPAASRTVRGAFVGRLPPSPGRRLVPTGSYLAGSHPFAWNMPIASRPTVVPGSIGMPHTRHVCRYLSFICRFPFCCRIPCTLEVGSCRPQRLLDLHVELVRNRDRRSPGSTVRSHRTK